MSGKEVDEHTITRQVLGKRQGHERGVGWKVRCWYIIFVYCCLTGPICIWIFFPAHFEATDQMAAFWAVAQQANAKDVVAEAIRHLFMLRVWNTSLNFLCSIGLQRYLSRIYGT